MAAEKRPDQGDGIVGVWSTEGNLAFTIERGQNPRIGSDSHWVSALQKPLAEDLPTARPKNRRAGQTQRLLDKRNGSRRASDFVLSYDMTDTSTYLLDLPSPETKTDEEGSSNGEAPNPAAKERNSGTLHQVPLHRDRLVRIGHQDPEWWGTKEDVSQVVTHPKNDHFAYVFPDEETGGDTLHIVKRGIRAWYKGEKKDYDDPSPERDERFNVFPFPKASADALGFEIREQLIEGP